MIGSTFPCWFSESSSEVETFFLTGLSSVLRRWFRTNIRAVRSAFSNFCLISLASFLILNLCLPLVAWILDFILLLDKLSDDGEFKFPSKSKTSAASTRLYIRSKVVTGNNDFLFESIAVFITSSISFNSTEIKSPVAALTFWSTLLFNSFFEDVIDGNDDPIALDLVFTLVARFRWPFTFLILIVPNFSDFVDNTSSSAFFTIEVLGLFDWLTAATSASVIVTGDTCVCWLVLITGLDDNMINFSSNVCLIVLTLVLVRGVLFSCLKCLCTFLLFCTTSFAFLIPEAALLFFSLLLVFTFDFTVAPLRRRRPLARFLFSKNRFFSSSYNRYSSGIIPLFRHASDACFEFIWCSFIKCMRKSPKFLKHVPQMLHRKTCCIPSGCEAVMWWYSSDNEWYFAEQNAQTWSNSFMLWICRCTSNWFSVSNFSPHRSQSCGLVLLITRGVSLCIKRCLVKARIVVNFSSHL